MKKLICFVEIFRYFVSFFDDSNLVLCGLFAIILLLKTNSKELIKFVILFKLAVIMFLNAFSIVVITIDSFGVFIIINVIKGVFVFVKTSESVTFDIVVIVATFRKEKSAIKNNK